MPLYTISPCMDQCCTKNYLKPYYTNIFLKFTQNNSLKVAIDNNKVIEKIYKKIASKNPFFYDWLNLMSYDPNYFEKIDIEINDSMNEEEIFFYLSKHIQGKKNIIVFTRQKDFTYITYIDSNIVNYQGVEINIFDKDEAIFELDESKVSISGSVIATDKAKISNACIGGN